MHARSSADVLSRVTAAHLLTNCFVALRATAKTEHVGTETSSVRESAASVRRCVLTRRIELMLGVACLTSTEAILANGKCDIYIKMKFI